MLILVAVILIVIILNWSKLFTNYQIAKVNSFVSDEIDTQDYTLMLKAIQVYSSYYTDKIIMKNLTSKKTVTITGYKILSVENPNNYSFLNTKINLDTPVELTSGSVGALEVVCYPEREFKLQLYTDQNKYIQVPVNVSAFDSSSCAQYNAYSNPPLISTIISNNSGIYNDGDYINLTITTNASGQSLTADFSEIDSEYTLGQEVVTDNEDNTYNIVYTISESNENEDSSSYDINVIATDSYDFNDIKDIQVELDNTAPVVRVDSLITEDTTPILTGSVDDSYANLSLIINGHTYDPEIESGFWSVTVTDELELDTYDVNICASDVLGNSDCNYVSGILTIQENPCPDGYVLIPNDPIYATGDFCVMQFEAKIDQDGDGLGESNTSCQYNSYKTWNNTTTNCRYDDSGNDIVSSMQGYPLAYISQVESITACASLGSGYHLITNDEWMTIARNIEAQATNWSDGVIGSGYIPRGNSNSLAALDDATVLTGINKRNLILSNGNEIYDFAGNVSEWVNQTIQKGNMPPMATGWLEYNTISDYGILGRDTYNFTEGKNYSSTNGMGKLYNYYDAGSTDEKVFMRSGNWYYGTSAGVLLLSLGCDSSDQYYSSGFRCVVAP